MTLRTVLSEYVIRHRAARRIAAGLSVAFVAATLPVVAGAIGAPAAVAATAAAAAAAPCVTHSTQTPFARWGDDSAYFLMPNGDFAAGSSDWTLSGGSAVISGGEPFGVVPGDSHSLVMSSGSQAVSEAQCVTLGNEDVRMFVDNPGVAGSILHVQASVQNPLTGLTLGLGFDLDSSSMPSGWGPSPVLLVPNLLGGIATQNLTLTFTTQGTPTTWHVDDVFVDPFKSR